MSFKGINLNGSFGDEILIDNATHITIEHDRAITNNPEYENSDFDYVDIVIHCSDMPKRFKGKKGLPNQKFIRLTIQGWKDKLLYVDDVKFNDFNLEGVESD